jgi:hypothetical protein
MLIKYRLAIRGILENCVRFVTNLISVPRACIADASVLRHGSHYSNLPRRRSQRRSIWMLRCNKAPLGSVRNSRLSFTYTPSA